MTGGHHHLFALEFSLNAPAGAEDFSESFPHLRELLGHARRLENRGVFTRIGASLAGEGFAFSERLIAHLPALTTHDKPLYKLCQASSYTAQFVHRMARRGTPLPPSTVHALAVTSSGVETLHADAGNDHDPRWLLMKELGSAYRAMDKLEEGSPTALNQQIAAVSTQVRRCTTFEERSGPSPLDPQAGLTLQLSEEEIPDAVNPAVPVLCANLVHGVSETDEVSLLLGSDRPRADIAGRVRRTDGSATLRDVHGETLRRAILHAPPGRCTSWRPRASRALARRRLSSPPSGYRRPGSRKPSAWPSTATYSARWREPRTDIGRACSH